MRRWSFSRSVFAFFLLSLLLMTPSLAGAMRAKAPPRLFFERLEATPPPCASAERGDTLWLFAASGPGASGMPGTFAQGYTFDGPGWPPFHPESTPEPAGWHGVDLTGQTGQWWHVAGTDVCAGHGTDMSAALPFDPGDTVNDHALWCGRESACGWVHVPGYGNEWDQSAVVDLGGMVPPDTLRVEFHLGADVEGDPFDTFHVLLGYESGGDVEEATLFVHDAEGPHAAFPVALDVLGADYTDAVYHTLRFRFASDGAWSDEDGLYLSDVGAVWLDNLRVTADATVILEADFEDGLEPAGLSFEMGEGAGNFAALYHHLFQEDICVHDPTHVWAFFDLGTSTGYDYPGYPGAIPYGEPFASGPCADNVIESPLLEVDASGQPLVLGPNSHVLLNYWVYCDLDLDDLVFHYWDVAAWIGGEDCPRQFENDNTLWYGDYKRWLDVTKDVTEALLESAGGDAADLRGLVIRLGVVDMWDVWGGGIVPDDYGHGGSPYLDRIRVGVVEDEAAAWEVSDALRFQDSFPSLATGKVRLDPAVNVEQASDPVAVAGDSAVVGLNMDLAGGVAQSYNPAAGEMRPEIHLYWRVVWGPHENTIDPAMADPDGADGIWSPYVGTAVAAGTIWGVMQADSAAWQGQVADHRFAFDFADDYFEPGDRIAYFYRAEAVDGTVSTRPARALTGVEGLREYYQVRCLPTAGCDLLFVDDGGDLFDRGWLEAFRYNGYYDYDAYTVLAPSSGLQNGLAGRVDDPIHLAQYDMIAWDSGDLGVFTVGDAPPQDKVLDTELLNAYLTETGHDVGLWIMGDRVAEDLGAGSAFLQQTLGLAPMGGQSYYEATSVYVPRVVAIHPLLEYLGGDPWYWAFGRCPTRRFGLVTPVGFLAEATHAWDPPPGEDIVAGVLNRDPDGDHTAAGPTGHANGVLFNPYSYGAVRDGGYGLYAVTDYARLSVGHILCNLFDVVPDAVPDDVPETPAVTRFAGAWPNPFNPKTTVRFSLAKAGPARVTVHDVAGRLVRVLHDGPAPAGTTELVWDGRDARGARQASGVYLLRFRAAGVSDQRKLALVK
ncbi:MAG: T9SS type A sorting domain-containing protein [Candidatus Krumholzibacteriota bacterium]|nr:T9SS type A sorting domain-containing protein [Candidatus Krumholzibacteriota bacterium]